MATWRVIRGQPPRELYGGEVVAVIEAPTGNEAIGEYAISTGRSYVRINNDRIQIEGDEPFTLGFLNVERRWPASDESSPATPNSAAAKAERQLPTARELLSSLVGRDIRTVTGAANRVVAVEQETVLVATERTPTGAPVRIEWVQAGLDLLATDGEVIVDPAVLRYRSAFVGAVLLTLPGTAVSGSAPPRIAFVDRVEAQQDLASGETVDAQWTLPPGEAIRRVELHDRYGGSRQGGTIPSASTPNIFLFLDKKVGVGHGYYDGWAGDRFYYTGHGQKGDQEFHRGNRAVLNHAQDGKAIRIFRGVRGIVTYLGEFQLDVERPWFRMEAPEIGSEATRQVIVFRLIPAGHVIRDSMDDVEFPEGMDPFEVDAVVSGRTSDPVVVEVPVEQQHVEDVEVSRTTTSYTAARREQSLVLEYCAAMEAAGHQMMRFRVRPRGEARELVSDVYDKNRNNLIEAKGTGSRGEIRMAIGQLFDYRRFITPAPACAILLPVPPRPDVADLLESAGISAIWKDGKSFVDNAAGRFV